MVTAVTNYGRSGLHDWILQRVTALILLAYALCIIGILAFTPDLDYATWRAHFAGTPMKIFSMMAIVSSVVHAWIGLWTVSTDYFTERLLGPKGNLFRWVFQAAYGVVLFAYLVWGAQILWGN